MPAALDQLHVLEVGSGVAAAYAAKLLADLGASVIKVEPPGEGDATRARGPFPGDVPHPEKSGLFLYLNANKRGITLDLTRPRGREILERLAARADLLVHDVHPREMAGRGLDYERLAAMHPPLVMTSIAPFGLTGPHAGYRGPDVVTWSAGGVANLNALQVFLQEWCREQSVQELYEAAQRRRVPLAPVSTMGDLLASPHLRARGFFATVEHAAAGAVTIPGAPCKLSATPWTL